MAGIVPRVPVAGDAIVEADDAAVDWITEHRSGGTVRDTFAVMGEFAHTLTIIAVVFGAAVVLAVARWWRPLTVLLVAVPLEVAVFVSAATLVGRDRPDSGLEPVAVGGSFPSGHAGISVAVYGGLAVIVHQLTTDRAARRGMVAFAVAMALAVAAGRMYLTMHHPSDIVAGWVVGGVSLWAAVQTSRRFPAPTTPDGPSG